MAKLAIGLIFVLAFTGFGYNSAIHIQKSLNDYISKYAQGGNVCACDNVFSLGTAQ